MIPKFRVAYKNKILGEVGSIDFIDETITVPVYDNETGEYLAGYELGLNQAILMQSTGLFDVNGKEIFEGDVVKLVDEYGSGISMVILQEGALGMIIEEVFVPFVAMSILSCVDYTLEVIGNIYENPELLEATNN
ncbi:YopX family protein [Streptococcus porcorum]|uniref:Phage protein (TIGR01671 family) n=1 Tax=Streptococcus porcorum TaxID=701526 RepID=A0ABV2JFB5_9STRE